MAGTENIRVWETHSPEETFSIGELLGREALAGQIYTLIGDLGVGKTVFTQGVAAGLGITGTVNSPTFTIMQVYEVGVCPFIILMSTASAMWRRWRKLATRNIFTERECA